MLVKLSTAESKPVKKESGEGAQTDRQIGNPHRINADLLNQSAAPRNPIADLNQRTITDLLLAKKIADLQHGTPGDNANTPLTTSHSASTASGRILTNSVMWTGPTTSAPRA